MNYFELHVGDYQRKTAHLSLAEHGAYSLMLQAFYATEKPLPENRKILYRMLRVASKTERTAVDSVCDQFWYAVEGGLSNKRAEQVLAAYHNWLAKQKANGSQGGRPPKPKDNPSLTQGLPLGFSGDNPNETHGVTQTEPNGGYRARVPLPTSHLDLDLDSSPTPTPPSQGGAHRQRRSPDRARRDEALVAWTQVVTAEGATDDPKARQAMRAIGGYSRIRLRTVQEEAQIRREFIDAYRSAP
jgi:uncharacterized protein YdaU (DUF1376 family)